MKVKAHYIDRIYCNNSLFVELDFKMVMINYYDYVAKEYGKTPFWSNKEYQCKSRVDQL